ncbi:hypothetical protein LOK74_19690 [Brevibacillus humidisoli]|uniref:hypothetical protein n=1 Tax=Brevibacillus humidisoli TaxID=2895522 RepID=UPI001E41BF71|nr:hypothetical protein [Brevibacillus humidisoli]UFJ40233.1 hypothetical protein LOK74_19690 [Brevibacillus humidisoli]
MDKIVKSIVCQLLPQGKYTLAYVLDERYTTQLLELGNTPSSWPPTSPEAVYEQVYMTRVV